jgi:hypothetical protein
VERQIDVTDPADDERVWTNVYVQFSLPRTVRNRLDDHLRRTGTTLGREFGKVLRACLEEIGVDPDRALTRPAPDEDGDDGHHRPSSAAEIGGVRSLSE